MREWFAQLILYSQSLSLTGSYLPFGELGGGILHMLGRIHGVAIADSDVEELKGLLRDMPVHGDVAAGLRLLQEAGCSLVTLTNSPKSSGPDPLDKAGLSELFDRKFTVDTVRCFKPASATYALVQKEMEADPKTTWLVAAHVWDTIGAQSFGWKAALITRGVNAAIPLEGIPQPTLIARDISETAQAILKLI